MTSPHTMKTVEKQSIREAVAAELKKHVAVPSGRLYACTCGEGWKQMLDALSPQEVVAMVPRGVPPDAEDVYLHHVFHHVRWRVIQVTGTVVQFALKVFDEVVDDHQRGRETWSEGCDHPPSIFNASQCACGAFACRCHIVRYRSLHEGPVWAPTCGEDCAIDYGVCRCGWRSDYDLGGEFATDWARHVTNAFVMELPDIPVRSRKR